MTESWLLTVQQLWKRQPYFLHLTVKSEKPVVLTGAMRPPTAIGTDADLNLLDAIRVAASPISFCKGVLTILNNEIQCARDVVKTNTFRVETFKPNELGFLGYADSDGEVVFYRAPLRRHTTTTEFQVDEMNTLPRVDIVYCYAGSDELLINAVRSNHSDGLVLAGFGGGSFPPKAIEAAAQAVAEGIPVVLASRSIAGRVVMTPRKEEQQFIASDNLQTAEGTNIVDAGLDCYQGQKSHTKNVWRILTLFGHLGLLQTYLLPEFAIYFLASNRCIISYNFPDNFWQIWPLD